MTNNIYLIKPPGMLWWIPERIIPVKIENVFRDEIITAKVKFKNGICKYLQFEKSDVGQVLFKRKADAEKALLGV